MNQHDLQIINLTVVSLFTVTFFLKLRRHFWTENRTINERRQNRSLKSLIIMLIISDSHERVSYPKTSALQVADYYADNQQWHWRDRQPPRIRNSCRENNAENNLRNWKKIGHLELYSDNSDNIFTTNKSDRVRDIDRSEDAEMETIKPDSLSTSNETMLAQNEGC